MRLDVALEILSDPQQASFDNIRAAGRQAARALKTVEGHIAELEAALQAVLDAETVSVHVGYDNALGGGNFVYADAVRTDDESFAKVRAALKALEDKQ